jgi:hypothetical protein
MSSFLERKAEKKIFGSEVAGEILEPYKSMF